MSVPGRRHELFEIADQQQGFFTAKQAIASGYARNNHHRYVKSGEWVREGRGIYRLASYPVTDRPDMAYWSLWSRDRNDQPMGIFSHATALAFYNLSDVMPEKLYLTVPTRFRRSVSTPRILRLIYRDIPDSDKKRVMGFFITTPLRTLIDVIEDGSISSEFIKQAVSQAFSRGVVRSRSDFFEHPYVKESPELAANIRRYID